MVPSMNNAYPTNRWGRRFKSQAYVAWERLFAKWAFLNALVIAQARAEFSKPKHGHIVEIHCDYFFRWESILRKDGVPKRNDTSNRLKILHDAISGAIWLDDCHFFDGSFTKRVSPSAEEFVNVRLEWILAPWSMAKPLRVSADVKS